MGKLFEHIEGNRFKLSEDLKETEVFNDENKWRIVSKIEEQQALQFICRKIIPLDVDLCNKQIDKLNKKQGKNYQFSHVKVEDVVRTLKKVMSSPEEKVYETSVPDPHPKLKNRRMNAFRYKIFKGNVSRSLSIGISNIGVVHVFGNQDELNRVFSHQQFLKEMIEPRQPNWGHISKMEEAKGLEAIKKIWIPQAVEMWNKIHRKYKVNAEDILKNLRKVRHDSKNPAARDGIIKYNSSDIIHYQYDVPNTKESITFMIHRFSNPFPYRGAFPDRSLMAGFFSGSALFEKPVVV